MNSKRMALKKRPKYQAKFVILKKITNYFQILFNNIDIII